MLFYFLVVNTVNQGWLLEDNILFKISRIRNSMSLWNILTTFVVFIQGLNISKDEMIWGCQWCHNWHNYLPPMNWPFHTHSYMLIHHCLFETCIENYHLHKSFYTHQFYRMIQQISWHYSSMIGLYMKMAIIRNMTHFILVVK